MAQAVTTAAQGIPVVNAKQVQTTATQIDSLTAGRKTIVIENLGPNAIYVGFSNAVTTANGFQIPSGQMLAMDLANATTVWAIAATANQSSPNDTRVIETR